MLSILWKCLSEKFKGSQKIVKELVKRKSAPKSLKSAWEKNVDWSKNDVWSFESVNMIFSKKGANLDFVPWAWPKIKILRAPLKNHSTITISANFSLSSADFYLLWWTLWSSNFQISSSTFSISFQSQWSRWLSIIFAQVFIFPILF